MTCRNLVKRTLSIAVAGLSAVSMTAYADPPANTKLHTRQIAKDVFANPSTVIEGSHAQLQRSTDAIWIKVNTTLLPAGAYTVWGVIFNNPAACAGGAGNCGAPDLGNPAVQASVLWATGGTVEGNGVGHFASHIEKGMPPGQVLRGPGLVNPETAEVHLIVRYHGPVSADPAIALQQTTNVVGGCNLFPCYEPQAARFPLP